MKLITICKKIIINCLFLLKICWNLKKSVFFIYFFIIIIESIKPFSLIIFSKLIIDELQFGENIKIIIIYVMTMLTLQLLLNIAGTILNYYVIDNNHRLTNAIGKEYTEDYMKIDYKYNESGRVMNLVKQFYWHVQPTDFIKNISEFISSIIQVFGCIYIISYLEPLMLIVIFSIIIINLILNEKQKENGYNFEVNQIHFLRKLDYLTNVMSSYDFGKEVRINQVGSWTKKKYNVVLSAYRTVLYAYTNNKLKLNLLLTSISIIQEVFIYGYYSYQVLQDQISVGSFSMLIASTSLFIATFSVIFKKVFYFKYLTKHIDTYKKYTELIENGCSTYGKRHVSELDINNLTIEFKDVSLKYPGTEDYALENISLKIKPCQKVAIVGLNGSGKTSFVKLLSRLYEPTEGEITLNGINIKNFIYEEYMNLLSIILQDFKLLAFSIKNNIVLNNPYNEKKFKEVITKSGLDDKIYNLDRKEHTTIYKEFDSKGIEFSGGELQKLALARALYKNAPIIIMDEPTSALDPIAEYEMFSNLNNMVENKTAIFISHRLYSTKFCDEILVFYQGKIIERGTHQKLIEDNKHYASMYSKQAIYYQKQSMSL